MTIDDKDIYIMMRKDQEKGFRMIMTKFGEPIYWHIRRLVVFHDDAQDAEQNTFIKVFRSFNDLRNPEALSGWIYRIATHEAMNLIAKNKHPRELLQSIDSTTANAAADSYIDYSDVEAVRLQKAILSLPPKQQVVFNLRYYDDMDYSHIAEITETSPSTAKVNYHLAKEKVIKYMTTND
ncbi:sigma-70 family RNA polymerase sigma factor [uncultured Prevotella sp.]|uniref:RNA polymerase sigma factor n=1 Tax=uncultured Prevotella sp. TaxID=159272 RepID=UPI002805C9F4|nr:sigma-70 family RNA polymerase sigma factor [uncultured Prevotella sp.]